MYTPTVMTRYVLEASELDRLATSVYGSKYVGQQTGDMFGNDTFQMWNFDEAMESWHWEPWLESGPASIQTWLDIPDGFYDFEKYRQAPEPDVIAADLIKRGELPYGNYLHIISW